MGSSGLGQPWAARTRRRNSRVSQASMAGQRYPLSGLWQGHRAWPISSPKSLAKEWVTGNRGLKKWLQSFDLAIDTRSGDSFADLYGVERLFGMGMVAELVRRAGVPLVLGPQTIGPFASTAGRVLGRRSLNTATAVMSRDSASAAQAEKLGRPVDARSTDVVFALPQPPRTAQRDVILNVSGLLWAPGPHVGRRPLPKDSRCAISGASARGKKRDPPSPTSWTPLLPTMTFRPPGVCDRARSRRRGADSDVAHSRQGIASERKRGGWIANACLPERALLRDSGCRLGLLAQSSPPCSRISVGTIQSISAVTRIPWRRRLRVVPIPASSWQVDSVLAKAEDLLVVAQRSLECFTGTRSGDRVTSNAEVLPSLGNQAARGVLVTMSGEALRIAVQVLSVAVLARLLSPQDYGLLAMVAAVIGVADIFPTISACPPLRSKPRPSLRTNAIICSGSIRG